MKRKLLVLAVLNLVLCAPLPWVYRWGMARFFGQYIFEIPVDRTLKADTAFFTETDTVRHATFVFVVPRGAGVQLSSGLGQSAFCRFWWDSTYVIAVIETDSIAVHQLTRVTERVMYARWHPAYLVLKVVMFQGPIRDLAHIKTPWMEGYGWEKMGEKPYHHYELTDGKATVTLFVRARKGWHVMRSIENVVASIRPIEQKSDQ
ncbi:MAG: hypothetical protein ACE5JA_00830 [bacterium]